jgi:hypothetical protein
MNGRVKGALAGTAILLGLAGGGCGGGGGSSTSAEAAASKAGDPVLAKAHFIFHASTICRKGLEQADVAMHKAAGESAPRDPSSAPAWESVKLPVKVVLPAFRRIATQLEALEPPKGQAYDYENFLGRLREELKQAEGNPNAPVSSRPLARAGKTAYVWGLHDCLF